MKHPFPERAPRIASARSKEPHPNFIAWQVKTAEFSDFRFTA